MPRSVAVAVAASFRRYRCFSTLALRRRRLLPFAFFARQPTRLPSPARPPALHRPTSTVVARPPPSRRPSLLLLSVARRFCRRRVARRRRRCRCFTLYVCRTLSVAGADCWGPSRSQSGLSEFGGGPGVLQADRRGASLSPHQSAGGPTLWAY